jgi:hypothetical protein
VDGGGQARCSAHEHAPAADGATSVVGHPSDPAAIRISAGGSAATKASVALSATAAVDTAAHDALELRHRPVAPGGTRLVGLGPATAGGDHGHRERQPDGSSMLPTEPLM